MKIGFLGAGSWGFCLTSLLASKGYQVISWTTNPLLAKTLNETKIHPRFPQYSIKGDVHFTTDLSLLRKENVDLLVESVTSAGIRSVLQQCRAQGLDTLPIVLTSKGIEQNSCLILPDVVLEVFGEEIRDSIAVLSGPSFAADVIRALPTSVVASGFSPSAIELASQLFSLPSFRVYPNADIYGVAYGGALKNVIAIACGIAQGLELGASASAALMTRGLHEVRKLAIARGCRQETLNGLSGMGDFVLTCHSRESRNFDYGFRLAQGKTPKEAAEEIGSVVEGSYTALSALQVGAQLGVPLPIMEAVQAVIEEKLKPQHAVALLMQRTIKEENL